MSAFPYISDETSENRKPSRSEKAEAFTEAKRQLPPAFEALLLKRGWANEEARTRFLFPCAEDLHDPYGLKDMDRAVERVLLAVNESQGILIYGDYDADGITSTALLKQYLEGLGVRVHTYIPDRLTEGYGMSCAVIDSFLDKNVQLIVTVDTGSTACLEIAYAKKQNIDTVVTDHHECVGELPACAAVVNPMRPDCTYPFKGLAGVGVVFKLICALEARLCGQERSTVAERMLSLYGDLVALGTVADVMPMLDENRYIVRVGLAVLEKGTNKGLSALCGKIGVTGKKATSATFGYSIAPHINAAGRMGHAECALSLLLCKKSSEASLLAGQLCAYNQQRKIEEQIIFEEAEEMICEGALKDNEVLVLFKDGWHPGVLGIVAAKITEKYKKPSFLISFEGEEGKGSCRSVPGMDLVALLTGVKEHTVRFGGHELAAGLTVKKDQVHLLQKKLIEEARKLHGGALEAEGQKEADMILTAFDLSLPFAEAVELLEPFGEGNPTPLFSLKAARIESIVPLSLGKHTRLLIKKEDLAFTALLFSQKTSLFPFVEGDCVDLLFELSINEYMRKKSVQLLVREVDAADATLAEFTENKEAVALLGKGALREAELPKRTDFARVYTTLRGLEKIGEDAFSLRILSLKAGCASVAQCLLILLVFEEQKLLTLGGRADDHDCCRFKLLPVEKKADLENSDLLKNIIGLP